MRPGETRDLEVRIGNDAPPRSPPGRMPPTSTHHHGGFGRVLRDEPATGATHALLPTRVIDPRRPERPPSLTVAIPRTSNLVSTSRASCWRTIADKGAGSVALDQIVGRRLRSSSLCQRSAAAIEIGGASTRSRWESTIAVRSKHRHVRMKPLGDLTLFELRSRVSKATIPMARFYAESATLVEVPPRHPPARQYTIRLTLADAVQGVTATEPAIVLIVAAPAAANAGEGVSLAHRGEAGNRRRRVRSHPACCGPSRGHDHRRGHRPNRPAPASPPRLISPLSAAVGPPGVTSGEGVGPGGCSSARWPAWRDKSGHHGPPRVVGHAIIRANDQLGPTRPPAEATPIDIIFLVERLESIIANGRRRP